MYESEPWFWSVFGEGVGVYPQVRRGALRCDVATVCDTNKLKHYSAEHHA
jgi:hypothetical protein